MNAVNHMAQKRNKRECYSKREKLNTHIWRKKVVFRKMPYILQNKIIKKEKTTIRIINPVQPVWESIHKKA